MFELNFQAIYGWPPASFVDQNCGDQRESPHRLSQQALKAHPPRQAEAPCDYDDLGGARGAHQERSWVGGPSDTSVSLVP